MQPWNHKLSKRLNAACISLACASALLSTAVSAQSFTPVRPPLITISPSEYLLLPRGANLNWANRDSYDIDGPVTTELALFGLGADGRVDVLNDDRPFLISEEITNNSSAFIPGDYLYSLRIKRMIFRASGNKIGWVPGNDATHTVHYQEQRGVDLQPKTAFRSRFDRIDPNTDLINSNELECGMYEVEMTVDSDDAIFEGRFEFDNVTRHYLFVEGDQVFNISKNQLLNSVVVPFFGLRPTPYATFDLSVPFGSSANRLMFTGATHTRRVAPGVKLFPQYAPAPGSPVIFNMGMAPSARRQAITMMVSDPTPNPATEFFELDHTTKESSIITVMSEDGCTIRQRVASLFVR